MAKFKKPTIKKPKLRDDETNWSKLQRRDLGESLKYRDVYEDQQLERGKLQKKQTPTSRIALNITLSLFIFIGIWSFYTLLQVFGGRFIQNLPEVGFKLFLFKSVLRKLFVAGSVSLIFFAIFHQYLMKNLEAQNAMSDTVDINQYTNDQHIALPEELQADYDWFPDVGATSDVQVSTLISHMALNNNGLKKIEVAKRATKDILDEDGDLVYHKGDILYDEDGNPIVTKMPVFDTEFMEALFDASNLPKDKSYRKYYDPSKIPYNPNNENREKLSGYDSVADLINGDWQMPIYEPQRPGGAYLVDTAPVNTMIVAMTRAGKGQTVIEPTIDMVRDVA